ncbi:MAG TPA: hypothetical protein VFD92_05325 [Candidatus Binatia bacterium]|nr:hypothetical protein [Candidatus Binatia bacterium]
MLLGIVTMTDLLETSGCCSRASAVPDRKSEKRSSASASTLVPLGSRRRFFDARLAGELAVRSVSLGEVTREIGLARRRRLVARGER